MEIEQIEAALRALGRYTGDGGVGEHVLEAERLGVDPDGYQYLLTNVLLGAAQREAIDSDPSRMTRELIIGSYQQQLVGAGVLDDDQGIRELLIWQALRLWGLLRVLANRPEGKFDHPSLYAAECAINAARLLLTDATMKLHPDIQDCISSPEWAEVAGSLTEAQKIVQDLRQ
ncbi:hypothetical protein SAMN02982929_05268 [Saccharopolyspora kobensis]|uniref:Uncharacterized protein n=1 Tax=Saccharopolyspora kobensis TaxID=146035 RepID=A0A1H6E0E3_9PSEU|nr:DUF6245 family protein [Saccharopolyspora kobensis]SEG90603.1 hypothetical protein SAMN02982929_05268 [Saccharopolyspora kobensis]SFD92466.1 hypothetical protein SAMN05216506_107244 [Saccharopolyspora kobensis]